MKKCYLGLALLIAAFGAAGCNKSGEKVEAPAGGTAVAHTHEEWWCNEHGVPEEICAQCHPKVAAELKAKGDWCQKHDRPDSQCFICHPELVAKFAEQYEAKYGKQPPKPEIQ
jgi:cobalt-zinc-cadmium efflux system membrane fusion protein